MMIKSLRPATLQELRLAYRGRFNDEWLAAYWRRWRAQGHGSLLLDALYPPAVRGGARNFWSQVTSVEIAAAVAAFKTMLQILSGTNVITVVQGAEISFDGISNTAEPVQWEILRQTTAGTMSARNPLKTKDTSTALSVTGQENATVEPTAGDILKGGHIHPQAGLVYPLPLPDGEIEVASAGRVGLRVNAPAAVNCRAGWNGEE